MAIYSEEEDQNVIDDKKQDISNKTYKVAFEIEVDATDPLAAAKTVQEWLQNPNDNWQYYVQENDDSEINSVDLDEDDSCAVLPADNYYPMIKN